MIRLIAPLLLLLATAAAAQPRTVPAWQKEGKPKDQPTRLIEDLPGFRPQADARLDRFGGWTGATRKATGFFRLEKSDGRWWMITPDGHPYFNIAATSVS